MSKYAPCRVCGGEITSGRRDRKTCSPECKAQEVRDRANAWHAEHGKRPDVRQRRAQASRKRYLAVVADPNLLAAQRAMTAEWRARSRETMRAQEQAWRAANPDRVREKLHRRRAQKMAAYVAPVDADLLWERDGDRCGICGGPIDRSLKWPDRMCLTVDHIVALADGGTHEPANTQLAHLSCNARKGCRLQRG